MKILNKTCVSITVELDNNNVTSNYYVSSLYNVYVNGELKIEGAHKNVFTLFNLTPDTEYNITINNDIIKTRTLKISKVYEINPYSLSNDTSKIQEVINQAEKNSLIVINSGLYKITSLFLKDDITIEFKKGAYLKALTDEKLFQDLDEYFITKDGKKAVLGTWEGNAHVMKASIITGIEAKNVTLVGEGSIDGDAVNSTWWYNFREKPYARPHLLFLNHCENINVIGVHFKNSPCWTIHPFYSKQIGFYDFRIDNPKDSPNTDGINPQSSQDVKIIGIHFSVGDDCVSVKSGKIEMVEEFYQPSINITIRNCLMKYGHGAVVLGSEMSSGVKNIEVTKCYFKRTDRGLRIKTRRGRGNKSVVDNVIFKDITMEDVLSPITINMYYNCDPNSNTPYIYSKDPLPVDELTPKIGHFKFENINATGCEYCIAYCYGLPEMPIEGLEIINSKFSFKEDCGWGNPIMMLDAEHCHKRGVIGRNVAEIKLINVNATGYEGEIFDLQNVGNVEII